MKKLKIPENILDEVVEVLIRQVGDTRECKHCGELFIPDDSTSQQALIAYNALTEAMANQ